MTIRPVVLCIYKLTISKKQNQIQKKERNKKTPIFSSFRKTGCLHSYFDLQSDFLVTPRSVFDCKHGLKEVEGFIVGQSDPCIVRTCIRS